MMIGPQVMTLLAALAGLPAGAGTAASQTRFRIRASEVVEETGIPDRYAR